MQEVVQRFISGLAEATWYEKLAVYAGIASVWFSKKENILVYPVGLVNTVIYIYISYRFHLLGESIVNVYYTIMSLYGWSLWARKDTSHRAVLHITFSSGKEWKSALGFFALFYLAFYAALSLAKEAFFEGAIPWADAFASSTAFTGMWLMARKKVESWYWWMCTNIASIPLFFVKGLVYTSVYYAVLLVLAVFGLMEWKQRAGSDPKPVSFAAHTT